MSERPKYAFLMIDFETPEFIKGLHKKIRKDELFEKDGEYGIEKETHVTLVPCLENDINVDELKKYLGKLSDYKIMLTDISSFQNEEFDVLKCGAQSMKLYETNEKIKEHFPTHSTFDSYTPHVTIAYLKCGMAEKYLKNPLTPLVVLNPINFSFSYWNGDEDKKIKFKI